MKYLKKFTILESQDLERFNDQINKDKLFNLLSDLGFKKSQKNKFTIFDGENGDQFIFSDQLEYRHFLYTRRQLDDQGYISEKDFNELFNIED